MAATTTFLLTPRSLPSKSNLLLSLLSSFPIPFSPLRRPCSAAAPLSPLRPFLHPFSSTSSSSSPPPRSTITNTSASFDWSDDDEPSKLPPPYDPFSKKPAAGDPRDTSDLAEVFHRMRADGLTDYAVKMFDGLSRDGLTHEALELFAVIKDKGVMPDVVAHTAVVEAYAGAGAGQSLHALRAFLRMLASGVAPNAYTYAVLIKGLARDGNLAEARRYLVEMAAKGMRPNVATVVAVFEAHIAAEKLADARALLDELKGKGFVPEEAAVREQLTKRGHMFRSIMSLLFDK
ncbi:pentatricopeptide repeat-containing protein At4g38150-like [Ananas comosus]|uniref:Pentatricopeptide repeat-containing protein At4g38150-like n=1 Tax=Ananas comosus TaxID=4615 RepID=A0A6P5GAW2_ANACO|nr:pentatricopeptide repeat-containing protein At4g38150-like [Ananas comosus]